MRHHLSTACGLAAFPGLAMAGPVDAFQLDERYVDNDGDLIADLPEDASQWVDPATIVFGYTPVEDPAEEHWAVIRQIDEISGVSYACN